MTTPPPEAGQTQAAARLQQIRERVEALQQEYDERNQALHGASVDKPGMDAAEFAGHMTVLADVAHTLILEQRRSIERLTTRAVNAEAALRVLVEDLSESDWMGYAYEFRDALAESVGDRLERTRIYAAWRKQQAATRAPANAEDDASEATP